MVFEGAVSKDLSQKKRKEPGRVLHNIRKGIKGRSKGEGPVRYALSAFQSCAPSIEQLYIHVPPTAI